MNKNEKICNAISEFLEKESDKISEEELRFLLEYYRNVKHSGYEIEESITNKTVLEDLKKLNEKLSNSELTPLSFERLNIIINLLNRIIEGDNLNDISYEIDKLYIYNDLEIRKNSNLVYKLKNYNNEIYNNKNYNKEK